MGENEGKKEEADYKRLQTFPLVRVSLRREGVATRPWCLQVGGACSEENRLCWLCPNIISHSDSFSHPFIQSPVTFRLPAICRKSPGSVEMWPTRQMMTGSKC